jgi:hypothetical protein
VNGSSAKNKRPSAAWQLGRCSDMAKLNSDQFVVSARFDLYFVFVCRSVISM